MTRALALALLLAAGLAVPAQAQDRPSFTLPDTALENLPPPRPPIDISGADIFTLDGLLDTIDSISDAFDEGVHLDNIDAFTAMGVDPSVMPELFREEMQVSVRVSGDWSLEHEGTARNLIMPFQDGTSLHRINIHLPGYAYPWVFATRIPDDGGIIRYPLISQLASALGNPPDLRNQPLTAAFGAAALHMFRPDRFDGRQMIGLDWSDIDADSPFDGPYTLVDHGSFYASLRFAEGPLMHVRAVVGEYDGMSGDIIPRPTGRIGLIDVQFCPSALHAASPAVCADWLTEYEAELERAITEAEDAARRAEQRVRELSRRADMERRQAEIESLVRQQVERAERQMEAELERLETLERARRLRDEAMREAQVVLERQLAEVELRHAEHEMTISPGTGASRYVNAATRYAEALRREAMVNLR
ncbi:MAG: hypothetical protein EA386_02970 [Rhodobacteraceae bacterium]|nr:MAG: hypothetical protein EA386_02970 [Paracoccaceae bacterium]